MQHSKCTAIKTDYWIYEEREISSIYYLKTIYIILVCLKLEVTRLLQYWQGHSNQNITWPTQRDIFYLLI